MSFCQRCEGIPEKIDRDLTYHFWPPHGHTRGKFLALLKAASVDAELEDGGGIVVRLSPPVMTALADEAATALSQAEVKAVRVLIVEPHSTPALADYPLVMSLHQLTTLLRSGWLTDMLSRRELSCRFEPIVHADDISAVYAHSAIVFGRDATGAIHDADAILPLARDADLLFQTDRAMRLEAIHAAAAAHIETPLFVSFSPAAIYDPNACLRSTVQATRETGLVASQIIFTINAPDHLPDFAHLQNILTYYRASGFRVALGRLGSGFVSFELFQKLRPDFLVFDNSLISGISRDPYKDVICRKILEIAQRLQIETVVPGIDGEEELQWLYEHGANYLQGPHISALLDPAAERNVA